ncbi:ComC/BlpC family leader-containing pheromone/bacteriocin [Streptococcus tangpeifui]|uniref:ComC/BlpC family leader-containing pheromone/bacteriocin n=1 Tax=Streptococcus tangpeifui TaxID=2709400 RepID=UPI0013EB5F72|nr:ComC/BlpC family leader-containing pheromone/bacteriocin [Streptococcus sp. ZJ373]
MNTNILENFEEMNSENLNTITGGGFFDSVTDFVDTVETVITAVDNAYSIVKDVIVIS